MKNGKKPTRAQRDLMKSFAKDTSDWLVTRDSMSEMRCYNRESGKAMIYDKKAEKWNACDTIC